MPQITGGSTDGARANRAPLVVFVVVMLVLTGLAVLIRGRVGGGLNVIIELAGATALAYGVIRRRPQPVAAWRFVAVSVALLALSSVVLAAEFRLTNPTGTTPSNTISTVSQLCLIIGLALLARGLPHRGPADVLDAVMTALAVYLVLWVVLISPAVQEKFPVAGAVTLPIGTLLIFTTALRLVFGGGLRDPAIAGVLVATLLLLFTVGAVLVLGLRRGILDLPETLGQIASLAFTAYGAVGLQPSLNRPRLGEVGPGEATRWPRMVLFAVLSLVPPAVWAIELAQRRTAPDQPGLVLWLPTAISAVYLLLLVIRLAMTARLAQRRADELGRRTTALARSMSEQQELQRQLSYRAQHDPLTGLANRAVLSEHMDRVLDDPRDVRRHALLLLDLDHFKDINDTLGHPVGDELLVLVARRLRELAPPGATLVRLGGDEFAVFLDDAGPGTGTALAVADQFLADLRRVYHIGGRELFVTTSIGVLVSPPRPHPPTPSDLLRDADLALYAAKSAGKDRITLFQPELRTARLDHARISAGLRQALASDDFVVHYQPVIELATGAVVAVEALLRWRTEDGRLVPPIDFIPVAEATGLVDAVGAWALRRALHDAHPWYAAHGVAVAVNVSGRQFGVPDFAERVLAHLAEQGLPGSALIVEITESSLVGTSHATAGTQLQRLRAEGVRIAIDDFGTGYSSLAHVAQLPVDIVKIDKSFTQSLGTPGPRDPAAADHDWAFTRAILQLVASLNKVAIAEGVETAEQAAALRALRCPFVQGFHYSRPVPAEVIARILARPSSLAPALPPGSGSS